MSFKSIILVVENVIKSRELYEDILGCAIKGDFGECNVGFEGGFALYKKSLFKRISGIDNIQTQANNLSIYFEFEDIISIRDIIRETGFELIHDIEEQPWGQLTFRFYDYDNHIVEIAESMDIVFKRLFSSGMTIDDIAAKTGYPVSSVKSELTRLNLIREGQS